MKEAVSERGGGNGSGRSAVERERTKMRERHRRSITTNIFHGLRKHGGYRLSPRADINEVLRHLAKEAGWIVEPDGTTYRSADIAARPATTTTTISNGTSACPLCSGGRKSAPATPSCNLLGGGGECSTSTSPRRLAGGDAAVNNLPSTSVMDRNDTLLAIYMSGSVAPPLDGCASDAAAYGKEEQQHQQLYLMHEATVSNQSTPAGSP